jgi:hypothetical protein
MSVHTANTLFDAEWIVKQHHDPVTGEWIPDDDEYVGQSFATLEQAQQAAVRESKAVGAVEWCCVRQKEFDASLGIPRRSEAAWDVVAVWHGDWDGNWDRV